jgi:hypothetical protein
MAMTDAHLLNMRCMKTILDEISSADGDDVQSFFKKFSENTKNSEKERERGKKDSLHLLSDIV